MSKYSRYVSLEERLAGLAPEQRLRGLNPEQLRTYLESLNGKPEPE